MTTAMPLVQDSPKDWIDILKNYTTILDCEKWWENVNRQTWLHDQAKLLKKEYFHHVASIAAKQQREKPVDKTMASWVQERAEIAKGWKNNLAVNSRLKKDEKMAAEIFAPTKIILKNIPDCPF